MKIVFKQITGGSYFDVDVWANRLSIGKDWKEMDDEEILA